MSLVGLVGWVVTAVPGGTTPGEVSLLVDGRRELYIAYGALAVERDAEVLVINKRGIRQVDVEPWSSLPGQAPPAPSGQ